VLHDNVVLLGTRQSRFTRHNLAPNLESDYFHLYLLTSYQKMRLSLLSGELMRAGANLHSNLREARSFQMPLSCFGIITGSPRSSSSHRAWNYIDASNRG
jgi:hypothetical protein